MKRVQRLLMFGTAFLITMGGLPVLAQETESKTPPAPVPHEKPATATPAQPPAEDPNAVPERELTIPEKRAEINRMANDTLHTLFTESPGSKAQFDKSYGYAVFDNVKLGFLITGGGGKGVAVVKGADLSSGKFIDDYERMKAKADPGRSDPLPESANVNPKKDLTAQHALGKAELDRMDREFINGKRTFMNMGAAGVGASIGAHKYQVVFLFENEKRFDDFVDSGWTAEAAANAVAGQSGVNAEIAFVDGLAIYQLTESGLMLNADIAGTKYWRDTELNRRGEQTDD
jgi:lipid-binding SYLF domain-containing protein